jgi:hypothetical protein
MTQAGLSPHHHRRCAADVWCRHEWTTQQAHGQPMAGIRDFVRTDYVFLRRSVSHHPSSITHYQAHRFDALVGSHRRYRGSSPGAWRIDTSE